MFFLPSSPPAGVRFVIQGICCERSCVCVRSFRMARLSQLKWAFALALICAAMGVTARAQKYSTVASFNGVNGADPYYGSLIQGTDGYLYGTTTSGGVSNQGTVFKVSRRGNIKVLHSFCAQSNCTDGAQPYGGVVQGLDGAYYGTTTAGGLCASGFYCGTVFKITSRGSLTTLYKFCAQSQCVDGSFPVAGLVQANDRNFYGTTQLGGSGSGTIFRITPQGSLTTINVLGGPEGYWPFGTLIQANDGELYGTASGLSLGCGTIFKTTLAGSLTVLFDFIGGINGCTPYGALVQSYDGVFYGTTMG